jgi:phenylpyruvate tautomerase PptA (4-oxalocrotonate tautomerase family)
MKQYVGGVNIRQSTITGQTQVGKQEPAMPHLQLEVTAQYSLPLKRELARRLGNIYAQIMQTSPDLVDVSFRELGEGNLWRCSTAEPVPSAVLICDIRAGRPPAQRAQLAAALHGACVETLNLDPLHFGIEFTQHSGDEIYRTILIDGVVRGGLARDWDPSEATAPLVEKLRNEHAGRSA